VALTGGSTCFLPQSGGYIRYIKPSNPGAGTFLQWIHNTYDEAFLLITSYCQLHCSAVVANRYFQMRLISSSPRMLWLHKCSLPQLANEVRAYSWDHRNGNKNTFHYSFVHSGPAPELWLLPGSQMVITVTNMDIGDTLQGCLLQVRAHRLCS